MTTPLSALQSAETTLTRQIHAIAGQIHNTGTDSLQSALGTLTAEVEACKARMQATVEAMLSQVTDLAAFASGLVAADVCGVNPAPLPTMAPATPTIAVDVPEAVQTTTKPREAVAKALEAMRPLTEEEAQKAYDEAVPVPISEDRIKEIVEYATGGAEEPVPSVVDGSPAFDYTEPEPSSNGKHRATKPRKRK